MKKLHLLGAGLLVTAMTFHLTAAERILASTDFKVDGSRVQLRDWANTSGLLQFKNPKSPEQGIVLKTSRCVDGWSGGLTWTGAPLVVVPALKYQLRLHARSDNGFKVTLLEYADKFSTKVLSRQERQFKADTEWKGYCLDYTPSSDAVSCVNPCVEVTGWLKRLELDRYSFAALSSGGGLSVTADKPIAAPGDVVPFKVASDAFPLKVLIYGPDGSAGRVDWDKGGSSAWIDHFTSSSTFTGPDFKYLVPATAIQGSYRAVFVNPGNGALAEAGFCAFPKETVQRIDALVAKTELPPDSRIVFVGDSLTDFFRGRNYVSIIERALKIKYPSITIVNAGVGGDNINRIAARLKRDVIDQKPTLVFLFEGGNDCKRFYNPQKRALDDWAVPASQYEQGLRSVIDEIRKSTDAKVVITTCSPADLDTRQVFQRTAEVFGEGMNFFCLPDDVAAIVDIQKRLAAEFQLDVVDMNQVFTDYAKKNGRERLLQVDDGVHLSEYGQLEAALAHLDYLSARPPPAAADVQP